eukprot:UN24540
MTDSESNDALVLPFTIVGIIAIILICLICAVCNFKVKKLERELKLQTDFETNGKDAESPQERSSILSPTYTNIANIAGSPLYSDFSSTFSGKGENRLPTLRDGFLSEEDPELERKKSVPERDIKIEMCDIDFGDYFGRRKLWRSAQR